MLLFQTFKINLLAQILILLTTDLMDAIKIVEAKAVLNVVNLVILPGIAVPGEILELVVEMAALNVEKMGILRENVLIQVQDSNQKDELVEVAIFLKKRMILMFYTKIIFPLE